MSNTIPKRVWIHWVPDPKDPISGAFKMDLHGSFNATPYVPERQNDSQIGEVLRVIPLGECNVYEMIVTADRF